MRHLAALGAILVLAVGAFAVGASARGPLEPSAGTPDILIGTVRSVDTQAGILEVLTGVGLAVRVERVRVYPTIWILVDGVVSRLGELRPGQIVRIEYRDTVEGKVAGTVETVPLEREGGTP